ncbi:hypothetical protein LTR84_005686 [Exophiala bonariae]|uniref:Enoyl reductase (ER) domain-containing protein n=1 Tax=Exophiala bonariae TaxID=1690606 RepID=A0AAV9N5C0_9EURO|nr:hypothetical protein LTR84_005686 [Exophiala bonariae]
MAPSTSRQWSLKTRPKGVPTMTGEDATFAMETTSLPQLTEGQVLVKTLYLSNDPAQRGWIDEHKNPDRFYITPLAVLAPMQSNGLGEVIESTAESLPVGTMVQAYLGWREYVVLDAKDCIPRNATSGTSPTSFLGALGGNGLTAYYGLKIVGEVKPGQRVVVSGAAGATGSMAVQIAKHILGAGQVIGIAGSDEKCRWVEGLGADQCLNYKQAGFYEELIKATDGYVDVFFDNVAGEIMDFMLTRLKRHGVVVACGGVAGYNSKEAPHLTNYMDIIHMRLSLRGFMVMDYYHKLQGVTEILLAAVKAGKIRIDTNEDIVKAPFEDIPKVWLRLFDGGNTGKLLTQLV